MSERSGSAAFPRSVPIERGKDVHDRDRCWSRRQYQYLDEVHWRVREQESEGGKQRSGGHDVPSRIGVIGGMVSRSVAEPRLSYFSMSPIPSRPPPLHDRHVLRELDPLVLLHLIGSVDPRRL